MVASISKIVSPAQGVGCFEKDGYARGDGAHRQASAWPGRGAAALELSGPVDPEAFRRVLEGEVPGGRRLARKEIDGSIAHRPGRDVTLSAPKSVSVMEMDGDDDRVVEEHDKAVAAMLGRIEATPGADAVPVSVKSSQAGLLQAIRNPSPQTARDSEPAAGFNEVPEHQKWFLRRGRSEQLEKTGSGASCKHHQGQRKRFGSLSPDGEPDIG